MKKIVGFYFVFIFLLLISHFPYAQRINHHQLSFLDIGQGDSIYIKTPRNCRVLIDAGKPNTLGDQLINIVPFNTKKIDLIIITHPDLDHYGGFTNLTDKYKFTNALISPFQKDTHSYQNLLEDLSLQNSSIQYVTKDTQAQYCGLNFRFMVFLEENANDSSIITHITFPNDLTLLAAGDISVEQELQLIQSGFPLKANIFKANHHGSNSSNHEDFINKIKPDYVVIQSGHGNSYGHPHLNVFKASQSAKSEILRNDQHGQIDFFFSGSTKPTLQTIELKLEK